MPATPGQIVMTLRDAAGATVVALCIFWTEADRTLRDSTYTTAQDGTKTGALIADNTTTRSIALKLTDRETGQSRTVSVPAHGRALTKAQLAGLPAPTGPITTIDDVNGASFDLA